MKKTLLKVILATVLMHSLSTYAGVTVGGTRVIYDGSKREATLSVRNPDDKPFLIQAWADDDGQTGDKKDSPKPPFVVTPPLFRLDPGSENIIRIIRSGGNLPSDKESVYWMNVKSIPSMPETSKNVLQIAVKTRIKLFYRPEGMVSPQNEDYKKISFRRNNNTLIVTNPTPWYMSFNKVSVNGTSLTELNMMAAPKTESSFSLPSGTSGNQIKWSVLNDFGGESPEQVSPLN